MDQSLLAVKRHFDNPQWYLCGRTYHVRMRVNVVGHFLKGGSFERILDVGCGDGSISLPFVGPGKRLTLLDLSDSMLTYAKSRVPAELASSVEIVNGDFMNARLDADAYDLIFCLGVLAYVNPVKPFVQKLERLLKPGGTVLVECHDWRHPVSQMSLVCDRLIGVFRKPAYQVALHSRRAIMSEFANMGFRLRGQYRYTSPVRLVRRFLTPEWQFRLISAIHGDAARNRFQWLGDECIFHFTKAAR